MQCLCGHLTDIQKKTGAVNTCQKSSAEDGTFSHTPSIYKEFRAFALHSALQSPVLSPITSQFQPPSSLPAAYPSIDAPHTDST